MNPKVLFLIILVCHIVPTFLLGRRLWRGYRRKRLRSEPLSDDWKRLLESKVDLYRYLPGELKVQLQGHMNVFLAEKRFEGCGGITITDEIRVVIAALACMLILNRKTSYYPKLKSILVYPHSYVGEETSAIGAAHVHESSFRSGESWATGAVVIAWKDVKEEIGKYTAGRNVVLHEFAHQLDQENGSGGVGVPALANRESYAGWAMVMNDEFRKLKNKVDRDEDDVLDEYGTKNEAEFFAVATETFFEMPVELKMEHTALYNELKGCYRVDPAAWLEKGS